MPFNTRAQLKTAVIQMARRGDTATYFDDALAMAEVRLSQDLDVWSGEKSVTTAYLANALEVPLPSDLLELISASVVGSAKPEIKIISPQKRVELLANYDGWPYARASIEEAKLKFARAFSLAGSIVFFYNASVTPLVADNDTNWVLQKFWNVYVYAVLIELSIIWGSADKLTTYTTAYAKAIETANTQQVYKGTNALAEVDGVV